MIIKMEFGCGWRFVDGVRDILPNGVTLDSDARQVDTVIRELSGEKGKEIHLIGYRADGTHVFIETDKQLYLCNDSGKTIERLN